MTERLDDSNIYEDGNVEPYDELSHGEITSNADLIQEQFQESAIEEMEQKEASLKKRQTEYEERLDAEANKLNGNYPGARSRLENKGIYDPLDSSERLQTPTEPDTAEAERLAARERDHLEQERKFGLTGEVNFDRTPETELAFGALIQAKEESKLKHLMESGLTLNQAWATIRAERERKERNN